jgi:hypothetical protein
VPRAVFVETRSRFLAAHRDVLAAADFFTAEVWGELFLSRLIASFDISGCDATLSSMVLAA